MKKTIWKSSRHLTPYDLIIFILSFICLISFFISFFENSSKIKQKGKELIAINEEYDKTAYQNSVVQKEIEKSDKQTLIQEAHENGYVFPDERVYVEVY